MSKTFILKRNPSQDRTSPSRGPDNRVKSLSREGSSVYSSHYFNSEFGIDGNIRRCPVHDQPRDSFSSYSPHNLTDRHFTNYANWSSALTTSSMPRYPSQPTFQGESSSRSSPRVRRVSPNAKHKDLKRKMVFDLHKEISKPIHTTQLEEISDMDRITEICMSTLKSMMESKKYRKYLHHMNNNNALQVCQVAIAAPSPVDFESDRSNNTDKKNQMASKLVGQILMISRRKDSLRPRDAGQPKRIRGDSGLGKLQTLSRFGSDEEEMVVDPRKVKIPSKFNEIKDEAPSAKSTRAEASTSDAQDAVGHISQPGTREAALKLLADISSKIEKQKFEEDAFNEKGFGPSSKQKVSAPITPEEALKCAWLRLSKDQIAALEQLMIAEGKSPGVHAHSDVTNYDVFEEIRSIRKHEREEQLRISEAEEDKKLVERK